MKICACIAEYNPLHLGHLKHIEYIKTTLGAERLIVIMSGNFCERGEAAVMDKYTRAKHAVAAGADLVIELPTVFATANAEIFATGAVKVLKSLGVCDTLCFGVESGDKDTYMNTARAMLSETKDFKQALKRELETGVSLAKAKFNAVKALNLPELDESIISSPNNILALEYCKAIIKLDAGLTPEPMLRGGDHNDPKLYKNITSAQSIRLTLEEYGRKKLKKNMPRYVWEDLPEKPFDIKKAILAAMITATPEKLAQVMDCTEGLENRFKALLKDNLDYNSLVEKVSTKRYTMARVRRIMLANFLGIDEAFIFKCLKSPLYVKILAADKDTDLLAAVCNAATVPVLTRKNDYRALEKTALECFGKDVTACELYNLFSGARQNEYYTALV